MTNKFIRDVKEVIRRLRNRGISFDGNRQYPAIPTIDNSIESHTNALRAIREAIETHERRNSKAALDSFVRLYELEDVLGGFQVGDTGAFAVDNVGTGAKVHKITESQGGIPTAKLRSIISSDGSITVTQLTDEIDLAVAGGGFGGYPDTIIADTAAELCSNRVGGTPVTLTYTPATDTPNAAEGHLAIIVTYYQADLVGGDGSTTVTGLSSTGWTYLVGAGSHMFLVHYKFLTLADLNTTFTYTLDSAGVHKGCRVVYIVDNVNTEAPFYSFSSDYYIHGNRRSNKAWSTMGAAVPSAAFSTGQHAFSIIHSRDYNAAADAWSDMGLVELGETSTWADLHVTEKSFPYVSSDIPCMQFRIVGRKANISRDENLIEGETELSSMQHASWTTNGVLITRPNTYYTAIEATGAGVIQHHAEQTLSLTAGEKVTFAVWFREESSYPNATRKVLMYMVDPSNNERGVFLTKDGTPRNLYVSEYLDTQSDRNTNWRYLAYKCDNDGNPSVDGMVLALYLVAPTTGTYKFRFCPAYYTDGTSSSYAAASGKLYVMHAGLRKGWHSPRKIWTPNGPVSNSAVMGVIDNPGYLLNTGDQGNNPFESQQFTMVLNPSWIKYPKANVVSYLANVDSTGQGVIVSGDTYTVPNPNTWTSDDLSNMFAVEKYVHPRQGGVVGKYYWEARCDVVTDAGWFSNQLVGIVPCFSGWASDFNAGSFPGIYYDKWVNGDGGLAVNDVIGVAMDFDAGQVKFYVNNVLKKTVAMDKNVPWAAYVAAQPVYARPQGQWTVRIREPFTYAPPDGFVEYDVTGDPSFSFGTQTVNVGGGAEILIPGDPDTYRTILSGAGISVTQETQAIRIAQNIPQLSLMGAGNTSKTADTIAIYDNSATAHKRVTPQEIVAATSLDDLGDVVTTGASEGQVLTYDGTLARWAPAAPTGGGGGGSALSSILVNDGCSVSRTTNLAASGWTDFPFTAQDRDDNDYWSAGTPDRFNIKYSGWYVVHMFVEWDATSTQHGIFFGKNGDPAAGGATQVAGTYEPAHSNVRQELTYVGYLSAGDYIRLRVFSASSVNVACTTSPARASIHRLGYRPVASGSTIGVTQLGDASNPRDTSAVPKMTSTTAPSGTASSSSDYPSLESWRCFNHDESGWLTNNTGIGSGQWVKYQFTSAKIIKSYGIIPWSHDTWPGRLIKTWALQGSNDDVNWTDVDTRSESNIWRWAPWSFRYFSCASNTTAYTYYRLLITANNGNPYVGFNQLQLYETDVTVTASGVSQLDHLTDVETYLPSHGDVLTYDAATGLWTSSPPLVKQLDHLSDVETYTPDNGDVLTYNATTGLWTASAPTGGSTVTQLDHLTNVETYTPTDGDVLTYDSATGLWTAAAPTGGTGGGVSGFGMTMSGSQVLWETDFLPSTVTYSGTAGTAANFHYYVSSSGTLTANYDNGGSTNPGIVRLSSGASSGGVCVLGLTSNLTDTSGSRYVLDADDLVLDYIFRVDNVSSADRYWHLGMTNDIDIYTYEFRVLLDNGTMKLRSVNNSVVTSATLSTAPVAGTWNHLQLRASSSSIRAYLNGALVATVTTNIPTVGMFPVFQCGGNPAGAVNLDIDAFRISKVLSTNRAPTFISASGGASGMSATHPDAPPEVADSMDDEFEGTTLDSKWAWRNQGTATVAVGAGALRLTTDTSASRNCRIVEQTLPSGDWKFRAKLAASLQTQYNYGGLCLTENGTGKIIMIGLLNNGTGSSWGPVVIRENSVSTNRDAPYYASVLDAVPFAQNEPWYIEIERSGSTLYGRFSTSGAEGTFAQVWTESITSHFTTAPDRIGIVGNSISSTTPAVVSVEWFRKIGTGYTPGKFAVNARLQPSNVPVTPDTKPTPTGGMDDEFEGTSLDSKWTWVNQGTASVSFSDGCVRLRALADVNTNHKIIAQAVSGSAWKFRAKIALSPEGTLGANYVHGGLYLYNSTGAKVVTFGPSFNTNPRLYGEYGTTTSYTNYHLLSDLSNWQGPFREWAYLEVELASGTLYFRHSPNGILFNDAYNTTVAAHLGSVTHIGIGLTANNATYNANLLCDWFRRVS